MISETATKIDFFMVNPSDERVLHSESKWWKWLDMCIKHLTECWWNVLLKEQSGHDLCQGYWISEWASQQNRDTLKTTIWKEVYDKCHNIARRTWVLFQYSSENG